MLATILVNPYDAYLLLTDADRAGAFSEAEVQAMALSAVDSFSTGLTLALVLFGIHVLLLGYLLYRSRYIPRVLGALVGIAGASYIVNSLASILVTGYGGPVSVAIAAPAYVAELLMALWLLVKGANTGSSTPGGHDARPQGPSSLPARDGRSLP